MIGSFAESSSWVMHSTSNMMDSVCSKCGLETETYFYGNLCVDCLNAQCEEGEVVDDEQEKEFKFKEDKDSSICFHCNPKTHPVIGLICNSCKLKGWQCYYDYAMGETICYQDGNIKR